MPQSSAPPTETTAPTNASDLGDRRPGLPSRAGLDGIRATFSLPLPNVPALAGVTVAFQAFVGPTAAPLGASSTNGVHATLGY